MATQIDFQEVVDMDIVLAALIVEKMRTAGKDYLPAARVLLKTSIVAFEQYRVETCKPTQSSNWLTKIEDAEGNEVKGYVAGSKNLAALAHLWAILEAAGRKVDNGRR